MELPVFGLITYHTCNRRVKFDTFLWKWAEYHCSFKIELLIKTMSLTVSNMDKWIRKTPLCNLDIIMKYCLGSVVCDFRTEYLWLMIIFCSITLYLLLYLDIWHQLIYLKQANIHPQNSILFAVWWYIIIYHCIWYEIYIYNEQE